MAGKRSRAATKGLRPSSQITGAQRKARKLNIEKARRAKKKGGGGFGSGARVSKADRASLTKRSGKIIARLSNKSPNLSVKGMSKRSPKLKSMLNALSSGKW